MESMFNIRVEQDEEMWSAYSDELGLGSCGKTRKEAINNLKLAILMTCRILDRKGVLLQRLIEKGILSSVG